MRECCGANDHPDTTLFMQTYKLVSTYSLIKPPKGCNVEGNEILEALLKLKDVENRNERKERWESIVDTILDKGSAPDILGEASRVIKDHDYTMSETSEYALSYIAGYVSRKSARFVKYITNNTTAECNDCLQSLTLLPHDVIPERHKLIELKSRGSLKHPSVKLFDLIQILEIATIGVVKEGEVHVDTIFEITQRLEEISPLPFVGCEQHAFLLTRRIVIFYLTMRMFFIYKQYNKNNNETREKTKESRKSAKLANVTVINNSTGFDTSKNNCCDDNVDFAKKQPRKRKATNKLKTGRKIKISGVNSTSSVMETEKSMGKQNLLTDSEKNDISGLDNSKNYSCNENMKQKTRKRKSTDKLNERKKIVKSQKREILEI